jgi:hypothetical protein
MPWAFIIQAVGLMEIRRLLLSGISGEAAWGLQTLRIRNAFGVISPLSLSLEKLFNESA